MPLHEKIDAAPTEPGDHDGLLDRGFAATGALVASITAEGWAKESPCAGWTVRQVGNHLVGGLSLLERFAREEPVGPREPDAQLTAKGAGAPFDADDAVVGAVAAFSREIVGEESRAAGRFGPALPADPADPAFTALLAYLGRRA